MRLIPLLAATAALGGCMYNNPQPVPRSPQAVAHLESLLAGRVAGPPVNCVQTYRADNMITIDDNTVVFKDGGTYYRNDFQGGGCPNLARGRAALVTRTVGTGLCRGDIAQVLDTSTGMTIGSCVLGDFVPFRKP